MKVTFLVEISGDSFANWLEYHTVMDQKDGKLEFPTEKGPIVMRPAIGPSHITYPAEINMWVVSQERPTPVGISFFLVPLVPDRVEVTAECHLPEVMDYFKDLLREIGKRWPETKEWLEKRPEEAAEQTGKPQVYLPTRQKDLLRWRAVWSSPSFRAGLKQGATYEALRKRIKNLGYGLPSSPDTIRKIVRAGTKGLLEPIDFEQLDRLGLKRKH